jgi:hypothetical protein
MDKSRKIFVLNLADIKRNIKVTRKNNKEMATQPPRPPGLARKQAS